MLSIIRVRSALSLCVFFFFKQKTAYEMRISDWSSDVCSSDLSANDPVLDALNITSQAELLRSSDLIRQVAGELHLYEMEGADAEERSEERRVGKECVSTCRSRW